MNGEQGEAVVKLTRDDAKRLGGLAGELEHLPAEIRRHFDQDGRDTRYLRLLQQRIAAAQHHPGDDQQEGRAEKALRQINVVRNSIVGTQTINWPRHIYPLVQALNEADVEGMDFEDAKAEFAEVHATKYGYSYGYEADREALEVEGLFCGSVGSKPLASLSSNSETEGAAK